MKKGILLRLRTSTLARYALSYLCVLALMLLFVSVYMYYYLSGTAREQMVTSQINRLSRIAFQHEEYMIRLLNTAEQIGLSPYIEPFAYRQEPYKAFALLRQMAPYTVTNDFCDQMYLHFAGDDYLYSSASSMTLSMFTDLVRYERVDARMLLELIKNPKTMRLIPSQRVESALVDDGASGMVTLITPLGMSLKDAKGSMVFFLKDSTYQAMFSDAIEQESNTYIFFDGQVLSKRCDFAVDVSDVLPLLRENEGTFATPLTSNGEAYFLLSLGARDYGMRYVSVLRMRDIKRAAWEGLLRMLLILLLLSTVCVPLAIMLARRNVRPLREISGMLQSPRPEGDELLHIQTGIRELSRRNMDLATRLDLSLPMQRHTFVLHFMKGRFRTREEAVHTAAALGLDIDKSVYAVVLGGALENAEQPLSLEEAPFDALEGLCGHGIELVALDRHLYVLFAMDAKTIQTCARMIHEAIVESGGHAAVSLSAIHKEFSHAPNAYLEAATAYDNRFVMGEGGVLEFSEVSVNIKDILPKARRITESINQALLLSNRAMLSNKIGELLHFLKHNTMSPFAFRLIYNDVIDTLMGEHAQELSATQDPLMIYDIFSLSSCQSVDDLDALLRKLCDTILTGAQPAQEPPQGDEGEQSAIEQVIPYMNEHFADPELSMSAIAQTFHMSTAHLSLSFKEATRMTPSEYLTLLRVERSKELLARTALSIKDISVRVGYYDPSSFIRRFKQVTGVTPLKYRKDKQEENMGGEELERE